MMRGGSIGLLIGVDAGSGFVHTVEATAANVHDIRSCTNRSKSGIMRA